MRPPSRISTVAAGHWRTTGLHAAAEDIRQHHEADRSGTQPCRDAARGSGKDARKGIRRNVLNDRPGAEDIEHHVGNDQANEDREEEVTQHVALKTIAEELDLRAIAEAFAVVPELGADQEETGRVHQARPGGHLPIDANPAFEGLPGAAQQRQGGHRGAEDGHHQQERRRRGWPGRSRRPSSACGRWSPTAPR